MERWSGVLNVLYGSDMRLRLVLRVLCGLCCLLLLLVAVGVRSENADEVLPYKIVRQFDYCWEGDGVRVASDSLTETTVEAFHEHIMEPILSALVHEGSSRSEIGNVRYCCTHYKIEVEGPEDNLIDLSILSDIKGYTPVSALFEELRGKDYSVVDIISEAPIVCLVFAEDDSLIAVTCNMFYDLDKVYSIARCFVKRQMEQTHNTQAATIK